MRVHVEDVLWQTPSAYGALQRLMVRAALGQHQIETGVDAPWETSFFEHAVAPKDRFEWRELLTRTLGAYRHAPAPQAGAVGATASAAGSFERKLDNGFRLPPGQLGAWSEEPLTVFLENDTDRLLVDWAARLLAAEGRPALLEAIEQGWLRPTGRGGTGELLKAVTEPTPMRCAAVIDSDRDHWHDPPLKEGRIQRASEAGQVPVHTLRGRELENYVPRRHWWKVVGEQKKTRGGITARARENQIWARLLSTLDRDRQWLRAKHGDDAFDIVRRQIEKKADRQVPANSPRQLLEEFKSMTSEQKSVDDLKARLGRDVARGVKRAAELLDDIRADDFDEILRRDLVELGELLEEWL